MNSKSHPYVHPISGAYASYIDIDPLYCGRLVVDGFDKTRDDQLLRYTPITVSQEELLYHKNINYEERNLNFPRYIEQMFDNAHYKSMFLGQSVPPFTLKFIEDPNSRIRVFIGVTMYQEPCGGLNDIRRIMDRSETQDKAEDFAESASNSGGVPGTMVGIMKNIENWIKTTDYKWEEICVCLLADGRTRINGHYNNLQAMERMGMYLDLNEMYKTGGLMDVHGRLGDVDRHNLATVTDKSITREKPKFTVDNGQTVYIHLFENVVHYANYPPMQFMFALKEFNAGKLDTHLWFFEGFAHHFHRVQSLRSSPTELYCVCLDAGTRPGEDSIVKLINELDSDPNIAGVCGEIEVDKNLNPKNIFYNWTIAAQNFEYKLGNLLDKACESSLGFISVLPGAFSAYRWSALSPPVLRSSSSMRPIVPYFRSVTHGGAMSPFFGNMYLAEDRVLCLELVCSPYGANVLSYVAGAPAVTDVPDNTAALTKQRRRWLNGSFFAQLFAIWQGLFMFRLFKTQHSVFRKMVLVTEFIYLSANSILVWFLPGLYYLTFVILWEGFINDQIVNVDLANATFLAVQSVYLFLIFTTLILAMGTQPDSILKSIRFLYSFVQIVFGLIMLGTFAIAIHNIVVTDEWLLTGLGIANTMVYFIAALLHGEFVHILLTFVQYTFLQPTYINVFQIFAFCNTHDLSWGTKGLDTDNYDQKEVMAARIEFRTFLVIAWSICNMILAFVIDGASSSFTPAQFMIVLLFITLGFNLVRFTGSCMYLVGRMTKSCCAPKRRRQTKEPLKNDWRQGTPHDPARRRGNRPTDYPQQQITRPNTPMTSV